MKEIGSRLKGKREENGLSVTEVADDLKVKFSDIESLEEGLRDNFKDIVFLKELIQNYAKYLGFDPEQMLDEFNEYLFEQTSRISLDDIQKARELKEKKDNNKEKIVSPYTLNKKEKNKLPLFAVVLVLVLLVVFFISYFFVIEIFGDSQIDNVGISYMIGGK